MPLKRIDYSIYLPYHKALRAQCLRVCKMSQMCVIMTSMES